MPRLRIAKLHLHSPYTPSRRVKGQLYLYSLKTADTLNHMHI
jgi:hypothetical protein